MEIISGKGKIRISKEVITLIVRKTVEETKGIVALSGGLPIDIVEFFSKNMVSKRGVKVRSEEARVIINFSVVIKYGVIIPQFISSIQKKVKKTVEAMTDIRVGKINVFVQGIEV